MVEKKSLIDKICSLEKDQMTFIKTRVNKKKIPYHPLVDSKGRKYLVGRRPDGLIVIRIE